MPSTRGPAAGSQAAAKAGTAQSVDDGKHRGIIRRTPAGSLAQMAAAFSASGGPLSSFRVLSRLLRRILVIGVGGSSSFVRDSTADR